MTVRITGVDAAMPQDSTISHFQVDGRSWS
jgi:hypothetical protein